MRLETSQHMRMEMRQKLAPRMIQSMEILQLPIMALQERIQQEIQENPLLEEIPPAEELLSDAAPEPTTEEAAAEERELVVDEKSDELDFDRLLEMSEEWPDHFSATSRPSRSRIDEEGERKHDAMQNMASRPETLQDYLLHQFAFFDAASAERELGEFLIHNLDDNGYLRLSLEELVESFGGGVTVEQAADVLALIQRLDPPGVGARDLRECLLLQITPDTPHREAVSTLISDHLDDLQHNRLPAIEKRTGYSLEAIQQAIEVIRRLNPRPGSGFKDEHLPAVVPDVFVEQTEDGTYQVRLEDVHTPHLHISRLYQKLLRSDIDRQTKEYITRKIQSAKWLIESIEQRHNTLRKVSQAIIDHQREFLDKGPQHIVPLKMQQIADKVGVHVTTVSRAVDDKWVQTPRGIFPLKRFFGGGTVTAEGEEVAWDIIRQKLTEIIDAEDKSNPYSDEQLVEELAKHGFNVARRTVTKYRQAMDIPTSRKRRQWTDKTKSPHPPAEADLPQSQPLPDRPVHPAEPSVAAHPDSSAATTGDPSRTSQPPSPSTASQPSPGAQPQASNAPSPGPSPLAPSPLYESPDAP